jgi:type II secretory ATPase GspE/PulE/Tfp pilus assembly ATPase PilB-like protein
MRKDLNELLGMLNSPSGLLLVTGPTGSGKTTTLYACLRYLHTGERKINTIEDPIEYAIDGDSGWQCQGNEQTIHIHITLSRKDLNRVDMTL